MPAHMKYPARRATALATLTAFAALAALMPTSVAFRSAAPQFEPIDNASARIAKLGIDSRFHADADTVGAADLRWEFPRFAAAQLEIGEPLVFALPGARAISLTLIDRGWIAGDAYGFSFSDALTGSSAEVVLRAGMVSGTIRANLGGGFEQWALASGTDVAGIQGDYWTSINGIDLDSQVAPIEPPAELLGGDGGVAGEGCDDNGSLIDVLFAYTPGFRAGYPSNDAMQTAILADLQRMNLAQVNSLSAPRFRSVGFFEINEPGTGSIATDLAKITSQTDGWADEVHAERDNARADLVVLYSDSGAGSAAYIGAGNQALGFSVVGTPGGFALARALGTNMGCCDAAGDSSPACAGVFTFSNAYRFTAGTTTYRTLMAKAPGTEIPYFSNPEVVFLGEPTGSASANNARSMSLISVEVASYRCSAGPEPDCDGDGILDTIAIRDGIVPDCNRTGIPDSCDIALGISQDTNGNGVPDECPLVDSQLVPPGAAPLDTAGSAVAVSLLPSDPVVLYGFGGPGNDVGASNAGAAWLLPVTAGVPNPANFKVVRASDAQANAYFGRGISVFKRPSSITPSYPALNLACIGAHRWTSSTGAGLFPSMGKVYIFEEGSGGNWTQTRSYAPPPVGNNAAGANALFGYSIAMGRNPAETSETIVVGAPGRLNGRGGVYVLRNTATALAFNVLRAQSTPADGDQFGYSVALLPAFQAASGNRVAFAVGAPGRSNNAGFVQVYERIATATSFGVWQNPITVVPNSPALSAGDRYGSAVAMVARPTTPVTVPIAMMAVGAPGDSGGRGRVYFFERGAGTGATQWAYRGSYAPPDAQPGDAFGSSVAISLAATGGDYIITVGAPKAEVSVGSAVRTDAGKIYILRRTPAVAGTTLSAVRTAFSPASGDEFGSSAASVRGFGVVGTPFNDSAGLNTGMSRITVNP